MYDALGAVLWTVGFVTLGYMLGAAIVAVVALVTWVRRRQPDQRPDEHCRRV